MPAPTMLWYDYETTGTDPIRDRPAQFADLRTDLQLQPIAEPSVLYCAPVADVLPHPEACLLTGITPQDTARTGLIEAEFAAAVQDVLSESGTCSAGYNSIRFDDNINRNLFYRNFFDPYAHAWKHGNARWDILDLARACYALRPNGIEWPRPEGDVPSFKLEQLSAANHLRQPRAHDALSDVEATVALARLLRREQPRLYDWHFRLRDKKVATSLLASALLAMQPVLHVSGRYPPRHGCLAMVVPIAEHPQRIGSFLVADLAVDPDRWVDLAPDDLSERLFTRRADLPDDIERPPLKAVHANQSPFLAPIATLRDAATARIALEPERCLAHLERIRASAGLAGRIQQVFASRPSRWPERADPECLLYGGFASDADRRRFGMVRATAPAKLATTDFGFDDPRYTQLLFRYRARNWPATLNPDEHTRWCDFVRDKLSRNTETTTLTLDQYFATISQLRATTPPGHQQSVLDRLEDWGRTRQAEFDI
jgi:exodeoxyribonuclease-1